MKKKKPHVDLELDIPIYNVALRIIVADEIHSARKKLDHVFGKDKDPIPDTWAAMCSWNGPHFGLFFERYSLSIKLVAHEVFHLTHRILQHTAVRFESDDHEAAALLHGYLMEHVMATTLPAMQGKK